jgi:hypothetical protein
MDTSLPQQSLSEPELRTVKKRVSPQILSLAGISGVGISGGRLTVYLERDSEAVRQAVDKVVENVAPDVPILFVVTGIFHTQ